MTWLKLQWFPQFFNFVHRRFVVNKNFFLFQSFIVPSSFNLAVHGLYIFAFMWFDCLWYIIHDMDQHHCQNYMYNQCGLEFMAQCGLKCKCKWIRIFVIRGFNLDSLDYWPNCFLDYNILRSRGIFEKNKKLINGFNPICIGFNPICIGTNVEDFSVARRIVQQIGTKIQNPSNDGLTNFWILVPLSRLLHEFYINFDEFF